MSTMDRGTISTCESQAVYEANHRKLKQEGRNLDNYIYELNSNNIECKSNV